MELRERIFSKRREAILKILGASLVGGEYRAKVRLEFCVNDLIKKVNRSYKKSSQSSVSQDLATLRGYGLVKTREEKPSVFYSLADDFEEVAKNLGKSKDDAIKDRALNQGKTRKLVIDYLRKNPDSRLKDVCTIDPKKSESNFQKELKILVEAGVATMFLDGKKKLYRMND